MGLFNFFKKEKSSGEKYAEAMAQRSTLKKEVIETLRAQNFTELEIKEFTLIIDDAEREIEILKSKLIGTNLKMEYPEEFVKHIQDQITKRNQKMRQDLSNKLKEVRARKEGKL